LGDTPVLSWRLSITMEAAFCVETLEDALARHGKPDIFNTDQGSQFTGAAFTGALASNGIAISMDGKGAWRECVRRTAVAQRQIRGGLSARLRNRWRGATFDWSVLDFYNGRRPHSSLDDMTPDQAYFHPAATPLGGLTPARGSTYRRGESVQTNGTALAKLGQYHDHRNRQQDQILSHLPNGSLLLPS